MNPVNYRSLAQEIASRYYSNHDPYEGHKVNVQACLRAPVTAVTIHLLTAADEDSLAKEDIATSLLEPALMNHLEEEAKQQNGTSSSTWRDPLATTESLAEADMLQADLNDYKKLHRRSRARMEAFLEGIALAVPSVSPSSGSSTSTEGGEKNPKAKKNGSRSNELSLSEGLAGFSLSKEKPPGLHVSGQSILRSISSSGKKEKQPQMEDIDLLTRLELYVRCLCRVKSQGQECVLAAEPSRALKARAQAIVGSFVSTVSTVRQQSPILTRLLASLTKELLAVEYLSPGLLRTIRRIVVDYEQKTSFASLAFLSTPDDSADQRLTPMVLKYARYLQADWKNYVMDCELELTLSLALHADMRKIFKTVEFRSIGHLLETCAGFRSQLQKIELAPSTQTDPDSQEKLVDNPEAVRQAIRDLQRERITVNGHLLPPVTSRKELIHLLQQTMNSRTLTALPMKTRRKSRRSRRSKENVESPSDHSESEVTSSAAESDAAHPGTARQQQPHSRNFHGSTIDALTKRLLLAGSRTGTGGDAYFVVRDLFGGEEVEVIPSAMMPTHGRAVRPGTIEILVRMASVTLKCHGSFDVYPKSMVRACEPLIQLHTTTTETIALQELRACDSTHGVNGHSNHHDEGYNSDHSGRESGSPSVLVLQERQMEHAGWRTLAIRPALYEKVEVWNTPS
jgi:hypothetical protein